MGVDNGSAAIQVLPDRRESGISQPLVVVTGHEADAFGFECAVRVFDFAQATFGVRHGEGGEEPEAGGIIADHLRTVIIHDAGEAAALLDVGGGSGAKPDPGQA